MFKLKKILFLMLSCFLFLTILFPASNIYSKEKWLIQTIEKADEATAKMIDGYLRKQQALKLNFSGNKKTAKKKIETLRKKIKKVNEQGIIFQYEMDKSKKGSTTYLISKENAKLYDYSVKFVKRLHEQVKKKYFEDIFLYYSKEEKEWIVNQCFGGRKDDYQNFEAGYKTFRLRMIYNDMISVITSHYLNIEEEKWDEVTQSRLITRVIYKGLSETPLRTIYYHDITKEDAMKTLILSEVDSTSSQLSNSEEGDINYADSDEIYIDKVITLKSFEEFKKSIEDVDEYLKKYPFWNEYLKNYSLWKECKDRDFDIITKNFSNLSDALKIYAIDKSGYFSCNFGKTDFGMTYTNQYSNYRGSKGMKTLLENKATGVCQCFADYESQLFTQLDIENYSESRWEINHAFTVVKVKNSKGKTLWIPFDYGIGATEGLAVDEKTRNKYLKTEEMRYKLYLRGIKGAPNYKNFTDEDFN